MLLEFVSGEALLSDKATRSCVEVRQISANTEHGPKYTNCKTSHGTG